MHVPFFSLLVFTLVCIFNLLYIFFYFSTIITDVRIWGIGRLRVSHIFDNKPLNRRFESFSTS
uniref:Secreted protein n=1 Tax=Heterorhabditis bacteriophora TaxID=37862 RepID=A0A1I7WA18_HETBA